MNLLINRKTSRITSAIWNMYLCICTKLSEFLNWMAQISPLCWLASPSLDAPRSMCVPSRRHVGVASAMRLCSTCFPTDVKRPLGEKLQTSGAVRWKKLSKQKRSRWNYNNLISISDKLIYSPAILLHRKDNVGCNLAENMNYLPFNNT